MKSKIIWAFALLILFSGCYSFKGTSIPEDVKHFSVEFFENKASIINPKLSISLTEQLKSKFISQSKLNIVKENGDFSFSGYISQYAVETVAIESDIKTSLSQLKITLHVKMTCEKHPELNFDTDFSGFKEFDAKLNFNQVEESIVKIISEQIVQEIFNKAAINW